MSTLNHVDLFMLFLKGFLTQGAKAINKRCFSFLSFVVEQANSV